MAKLEEYEALALRKELVLHVLAQYPTEGDDGNLVVEFAANLYDWIVGTTEDE